MSLIGTDAGHFRKYLTTLGVSLIAAGLSLGGLFFQLQGDLLVEESKVRALTPVAQETVRERQVILSAATSALPYFLVAITLIGLAMATTGLAGWARRQAVADAKEELEGKKLEFEVRSMTDEEKTRKQEREAQDLNDNRDEKPKLAKTHIKLIAPTERARQAPEPDRTDYEKIRETVSLVDQTLESLAKSSFGESRVQTNVVVQTGRKWFVDLLVAPGKRPEPGYVFEFTYSGAGSAARKNLANRVLDTAIRTSTAAATLSARSEWTFQPVIVLVFEPSSYEDFQEILQPTAESVISVLQPSPRFIAIDRVGLSDWSRSEFLAAVTAL